MRYVEFELNFESLRKRKAKRLGVKNHKQAGQKRALSMLDRATRKFHGDLNLWMLYLDVATKQKAYSKVAEIFTNVVRLHPTKPDIWILAASYAVEELGDMTEARSYMQRGLRFCKASRDMWLSYARLEMAFISKIVARQTILGLRGAKGNYSGTNESDDLSADTIALPSITPRDFNSNTKNGHEVDEGALRLLDATPALSGAIPMAVFDAAMDQLQSPEFAEQFFNLTLDFNNTPCSIKIAQHVLDRLESVAPNNPITLNCRVRQPLIGIPIGKAEFPAALGSAFTLLTSALESHPTMSLVQKTVLWISWYLKKGSEETIQAALQAMLLRSVLSYQTFVNTTLDPSGDFSACLLELILEVSEEVAERFLPWALDAWPENKRLEALINSLSSRGQNIVR